MDSKLVKEKLIAKLNAANVEENALMSKHTSFRCGGCAKLLVCAENVDELRYCLSVFKALSVPFVVLGNGSNTLFTDKGYDGVVLTLSGEFKEIVVSGENMYVGAAAALPYVAKLASANGLSGLEALSGIPGSMGGAIFMDAGAYDHNIEEVIETVTAVNKDGEIFEYDKYELQLSYRHSIFMESGDIIISCKLKLNSANREDIEKLSEEYQQRRKEKQPLSFPSAGSFFKRPPGNFAGALIEKSGLKGKRVGGAEVSTLHAGFIINADNASTSDVLQLSNEIIDQVFCDSGVKLEREVRIIGD